MREALVIVDFQRDFTPPDGALAVAHGDSIAKRLNELAAGGPEPDAGGRELDAGGRELDAGGHERALGERSVGHLDEVSPSSTYVLVVATRDWHPPDHSSFRDQGGPWPAHCVQGTPGAELHPALDRSLVDVVIDKGQRRETPGYSAFEAPEFGQLLREHAVTALTVVGLATDYCVLNTARDALAAGLAVTVDRSATRAVDASPGDGERALAELERLGANLVGAEPDPSPQPDPDRG